MSSFRDNESKRLGEYAAGQWSHAESSHPHILPPGLAQENLLDDVRATALAYFAERGIAWWLSPHERSEIREGLRVSGPTGNLLSSQVACINHLEPARLDRDVALAVASRIDPRIADVRDTGEGGYVAYEWIGEKEYLGERGARTRGANVTSLDAVMKVTLDSGELALIAIEWKYTESYGSESVARTARTDRVATYRALIEAAASPLAAGKPERLFYEPYYQLMRQTLLASQHVADPGTPETEWIHLHVIPHGNVALRRKARNAAPLLTGDMLEDAWRSALKEPAKYRVVDPTYVMPSEDELSKRWRNWRNELHVRYEDRPGTEQVTDADRDRLREHFSRVSFTRAPTAAEREQVAREAAEYDD